MKATERWSSRFRVPYLTITLLLMAFNSGRATAQDASADNSTTLKIVPPFAWNRTDRYEPPNYEAFFSDDVEAGKQLDLMIEGKLEPATVDERLALVRRGLRKMSHHRTTLLGSVGNEFIWNKEQQDPRAIELMYHASVGTDPGVAGTALYHGPTVVADRSFNLVRMLMEQYQSLDAQTQGRIAWGMKTYGDKEQTKKLLLDLLDNHEQLAAGTVCAAIDTFQAVFETPPPDMERFAKIGLWVIAFHRDDLSASHPRAAKILRDMLDHISLRNQGLELADFVTRVDDGHETAVALVQGVGSRTMLTEFLSKYVRCRIDFNEMLSPRTLQERRLREFAGHLPGGLPKHALPAYTRPPDDATYAYAAREDIAPNFEAFFADDAEAGAKLDQVYAGRENLSLSDRELLDLFRRGVRPLGPDAEHDVQLDFPCARLAARPASDRDSLPGPRYESAVQLSRCGNLLWIRPGNRENKEHSRSDVPGLHGSAIRPHHERQHEVAHLWGLGNHEDDKHYLATRFAEALRGHAKLSDEVLRQADLGYRQLTDEDPPNFAEYGAKGVYLVMLEDRESKSAGESKERLKQRFGDSEHIIDTEVVESDGHISAIIAVRGMAGMKRLLDELKKSPHVPVLFADLLTRELIDQSKSEALRKFEEHLPEEKSKE